MADQSNPWDTTPAADSAANSADAWGSSTPADGGGADWLHSAPAPQAEHALALEEGWFEGAEFGAQSSLAGVELSHLAPSERRSFASERAA